MAGRHSIECETKVAGNRWYIPAPIVYGVIVSLAAAAIGGGGSGLVYSIKIANALDKINSMPGPAQLRSWRSREHQVDHTQNERLNRLERKVFNLRSLSTNAYRFNCPSRFRPIGPHDLVLKRVYRREGVGLF